MDLLKRADKFFNNGRYNDAEQLYNQFFKDFPSFSDRLVCSEVYHKLGLIARKRQQYKKAMDYLVQAIRTAGAQDPQITFDYARILFDIGEYDRAISLFARLYERQPNDRQVKDFYAQTLIQKGEYGKAYPLLKDVMGDEEACEFIAQKADEKGDNAVASEMRQHIRQVNMDRDQQFFFDGDNNDSLQTSMSSTFSPMENLSSNLGSSDSILPVESNQNIPVETAANFSSRDDLSALNTPVAEMNNTLEPMPTFVASAPATQSAEAPIQGAASSRGFVGYAVARPVISEEAVSSTASIAQTQAVAEPLPSEMFLPAFSSYLAGQSDSAIPEDQNFEEEEWVSTTNFRSESPLPATQLGVSYPGLSMDLRSQEPSVPSLNEVSSPAPSISVSENEMNAEDDIFTSIQNATNQAAPAPSLEELSSAASTESLRPRRKTSEEKLADAIAAGASVEYLTPEEYRHEIATRAGTMIRENKEEAARIEANQKEKKSKFFFK